MRLLTSAAGEDGKLTGELTELLRTHETLSRRASKSVDYSASADEVLRQLNRGKPTKHHVHLKSCVLSPPAWTENVAVDKLVMSPKYGPRFPVLKIQFLRLFGLEDGLEMWAEFLWSGVSFGMVPLVNGCDVIIPYPEYWTQCTLAIDFFSDKKKSLPLGRALVHWSVFYELKFTIKEPQFSPLASAAQISSQSSGQSSGESTGQDDGASTGGPGGGGGVGGWRSFRLLEKLACPLTGRLAYKLTPRTAVLALRPEVAVPRPLSGELAPAAAAAAVPEEEEEDPGGEEAGRPTLPPRPESRGGGGGGGPRPPVPGGAAAAAASGSLEPDLYRLCLQIDGIHVREPPASPWESLASGTARGRGEGAGEAKEEEEEGEPGLLVGWHGGGGAAAAAGAGAEEGGGGGGGEAGSPPSAGGGGQLAWLRAREGAMLRLPLAAPEAAGCTLALVAKRGARAVGACRFEGGELARLPVARTDWACRVSGLWPDKEGPPQISLALISPDSGPAQGSGWRRGLTRLSAGRLRVRVWVEASAPVAAPALQLQIHEVGRLSGRWGPGMTRVFGARRRRPYPKLLWFSGEHEILGRPVTWDPVHIGQYTSVPPRVGLCSLPLGLLPAAAARAGAGGGGGGGGGAPLLLPGEGRAPFLVLQLWDQGAMPREVLDALVRAQALVRTFLAVRQSARRAAARARRAAGRRRRARGARALQRVWRGHRARRVVLQLLVDAVARGAARHLQRAWRGFACRRRCAAFFRARRAQLLGAREVEVLVHVRRAVNLSSSVLGDIRARGAALGRVEPYCVITWNGEKIGETRVARNDATNPVWKDEIFGVSFHLPTLREPFPDLELKLEVKNKSLLGGGFGQVILRAQDLAALVSVTAGVAAAAAGGGGGGEDPRAAPLAHQLLLGAEGYGGAAAKAGAERGARGAAYLQVQLTSARDLAAAYWPRAPRAEAEGGGWGWAAAAAAGPGQWAGAAARDAAARGAVGEVLRRVDHRLLPHGWSLRVVGAALRRKLDVYAVVYWEGIEIGRTPVSYNSKRPLWCEDGQTTGKAAEAHFNIPYPTCVDPILRIELWEKAQAKKSKVASLVGKVVLDVDQQKMLMKETASKAYHVFNQMEHSRVKTDLPLRKDGAVAAAAAGWGEGGEEVGVVLFADRTTMLEDHRRNPFDGSREADDPDRRSQTTASQPPREEEPPAASEGGGWARELDPESGAYYYAHAATGETRWEPPPGSAWARGAAGGEETGALVPYDYASEAQQYNDSALAVYNNEPAWEQVWSDEHQAYYWFRADTGESSWEDPSQLKGQQEAGEEDEEEEEEEEEEGRAAVGEYYNEAGTRVIYFRK